MTDVLIKRELLEQIRELLCIIGHRQDDYGVEAEYLGSLLKKVLAQPTQQGEVVEVAQVVSYLSACADGYDQDAPHPGPPEPLMTVAQHERIVAALSAKQSAHVSVPRELLQDLRDLASDAVDHHRQAFAGYKLERQANMDQVIANADALLNGGEA